MSVIYLESTINLLISSGEKEKVEKKKYIGAVRRVMVNVVGNGLGDPSSNPG